ncbi:transcriptional repressor [Candidatus Dojkabacteria bacterium]|jgi:Fe2+ or Zn2+ uptake regulation protein|uniref:Transcriptional repressor n=1 Tax=Candidatus Dojkabacteria bacterium TaxID=2099670 RepID=A0A955L0R1_9BACT|nr:transcriptional repressor [Candidatus Dojkabacteria bacterium]
MSDTNIIKDLKSKGLKLNNSRMQILELFLGNHRSHSAPELVELLKMKMDRATVYRNLNFFVENKILDQIQLQGETPKYELAALEHHHHLICKHCKKISSIQSKSLENALETTTNEIKDFTITDHVFEFYGLCKDCLNNEE